MTGQERLLKDYFVSLKPFFAAVRREGELALDPEAWGLFIEEVVSSEDNSLPELLRWALMHLFPWLEANDVQTPAAELGLPGASGRRFPRTPIFLRRDDTNVVEAVALKLGPAMVSRGTLIGFKLANEEPLRVGEWRYAAVDDYDPESGVFAVANGVHGHLKYPETSRGIFKVSAEIQTQLNALVKDRTEIDNGRHVSVGAN